MLNVNKQRTTMNKQKITTNKQNTTTNKQNITTNKHVYTGHVCAIMWMNISEWKKQISQIKFIPKNCLLEKLNVTLRCAI